MFDALPSCHLAARTLSSCCSWTRPSSTSACPSCRKGKIFRNWRDTEGHCCHESIEDPSRILKCGHNIIEHNRTCINAWEAHEMINTWCLYISLWPSSEPCLSFAGRFVLVQPRARSGCRSSLTSWIACRFLRPDCMLVQCWWFCLVSCPGPFLFSFIIHSSS